MPTDGDRGSATRANGPSGTDGVSSRAPRETLPTSAERRPIANLRSLGRDLAGVPAELRSAPGRAVRRMPVDTLGRPRRLGRAMVWPVLIVFVATGAALALSLVLR